MKVFFRRNSVKLYRGLFLICAVLVITVLGKGFYSVFQSDIKYSADNMLISVAEKICYHIYKEESSVFAISEIGNEDDAIFYELIKSVGKRKNKDSDMMVVQVIENEAMSETIFDYPALYEDESTDEELLTIEELALKENSEAAKTGTDVMDEGMLIVDRIEGVLPEELKKEVEIKTVYGEGQGDYYDGAVPAVSLNSLLKNEYSMEKLKNLNYLINNYYIVDASTKATASLFQADTLLNKDMTIAKNKKEPQILIYHTHASETYIDSKKGVQEDTVVGPGNYLAELLTAKGYTVYHDKTAYDKKADGSDNRNYAYSTARPNIEKILRENPSIKVVIDLHRDSGAKRVTTINGKPTAQIMFFNGLSRDASGPIKDLENPNVTGNLAFSLQTNLVGRSMYPGLMYKIYLKNYRYNMHLAERYLLIELGTHKNTVEEAYNAMEPLAEVLNQVLTNR